MWNHRLPQESNHHDHREEYKVKGHLVKRSETSWSLVFDIGLDEQGKRKQKWVTVQGTKKEAEKELNRLLHEMNSGTYIEPSRMTLAEYLEYWLEHYAKTNVAAKTLEGYAEFIRLYIVPQLGKHPLAKLQTAHIQAYYTYAQQQGRRRIVGGLSARSVLHQHRVLREALNQAVKWQFISKNPADAVVPPRAERTEMKVLDEAQMARLLAAAEGTRFYLPILLAVTTGLRRGEILGLRWEDINLSTGMLSVRQALGQTRQGLQFKPPKTTKSRRGVSLPALVVEALRRHQEQQQQEKALMGPAYEDRDLVIAAPDGQPGTPNALTKGFGALLVRKQLPRVRFHDLRHSHATQLLRHNIHPKVVSERLGHSTVNLTLDTYSHVLPGMQEEAALRVDSALRSALKENAKETVVPCAETSKKDTENK